MRAAILLALVVAFPALARDYERRGPIVMVQRGVMQRKLNEVNERLAEVMARAKPKDKQALRALRESLDELSDSLENAPQAPRGSYSASMFELDAEEQGGGMNTPPPMQQPPPPPQPTVYPISDPSLQNLLAALGRESFPQNRLTVLQQAAPANWFLVAQVQQLLNRFEFPRDRLAAMRILKPRILDTENYFQLYASFEFPADKAELKRILESR